MSQVALTLAVLPGTYAVCRLDGAAAVPAWATSGDFFSVTRTADELSVVCEQGVVPQGVLCEGSWRCLKVQGPLDFSLTGILASLAVPLAEVSISIFALSTYDTDYIMVKATDLGGAVAVLSGSGHTITL
ncbi:MAG: ACT domain-containing protein [Chloroflexota bacterium]|nr:ACT domain-containing protein [Chloroflexota bacterium]MDQ5864872.1 ACT domain-containing protein [Chloroflexota bacterium]